MTVKIVKKKGNRVVLIKRGRIRIAPTYAEVGDCVRMLIRLYGKEEFLRETGLYGEFVDPADFQKDLREVGITYYKGKVIGCTLGIECRDVVTIFEALDILEKNYPDLFERITTASRGGSTLVLYWEIGGRYVIDTPPHPQTIRVKNPYDGSYTDWKLELRAQG
jgi:hypothetical protein